jgi:hypothetical protein
LVRQLCYAEHLLKIKLVAKREVFFGRTVRFINIHQVLVENERLLCIVAMDSTENQEPPFSLLTNLFIAPGGIQGDDTLLAARLLVTFYNNSFPLIKL